MTIYEGDLDSIPPSMNDLFEDLGSAFKETKYMTSSESSDSLQDCNTASHNEDQQTLEVSKFNLDNDKEWFGSELPDSKDLSTVLSNVDIITTLALPNAITNSQDSNETDDAIILYDATLTADSQSGSSLIIPTIKVFKPSDSKDEDILKCNSKKHSKKSKKKKKKIANRDSEFLLSKNLLGQTFSMPKIDSQVQLPQHALPIPPSMTLQQYYLYQCTHPYANDLRPTYNYTRLSPQPSRILVQEPSELSPQNYTCISTISNDAKSFYQPLYPSNIKYVKDSQYPRLTPSTMTRVPDYENTFLNDQNYTNFSTENFCLPGSFPTLILQPEFVSPPPIIKTRQNSRLREKKTSFFCC